MNEELIKKAVQFKMNMAEKILEHLPADTTTKIKSFGHLIYESVGEHIDSRGKQEAQNSKTSGKVNNVIID